MKIEIFERGVKIGGFVDANGVVELQGKLMMLKEGQNIIDLSECDDLHTAAIQLLCAYKLTKNYEFIFADESAYRKALEGCFGR